MAPGTVIAWQPTGRLSAEVQVEGMGASGGQLSFSAGAGVHTAATALVTLGWPPKGKAGVSVPGEETEAIVGTMAPAGRSNGMGASTFGFTPIGL